MSNLIIEMRKAISDEIHIRKCALDLSKEQWNVLDSNEMAGKIMEKILTLIEAYAYLPCCHESGMHDPCHFEERRYICESQKSKAYERLMKSLEINPVVRSEPNCFWCADYPEKRIGEGLRLFGDSELSTEEDETE